MDVVTWPVWKKKYWESSFQKMLWTKHAELQLYLPLKGLVSCETVPPWSAGYPLVLINKDWRDKSKKHLRGSCLHDTWLKNFVFVVAPKEIEARGQRARLVYQRALRDGAVSVQRSRILLIGQDRAGKTSLKNSLIGLPFNRNENSTEGIEAVSYTHLTLPTIYSV